MATRLELAKGRLVKLEDEFNRAIEQSFAHQKLTNGQPMNDKRNGASWFKRQQQIHDKCSRLNEEIKKQKERVRLLEQKKENAKIGRTTNYGLINSVENIQAFKDELAELQALPKKSSYDYSLIRKRKKQIEEFEQMLEEEKTKVISERVQKLIDNGSIVQWKKQPKYYFVKGLRKVALIIKDGELAIGDKYRPYSNEEKERVNELIK